VEYTELPLEKKYNIIYADPPWEYNFQKRKDLSEEAKSKLYPTMKDSDIVELPIKNLTEPNAILFLWIMNSKLPLALDVISSWGFEYKTVAFTWVKTTKNTYHFGGGNWTRSNPELCLLATKGKISRVSASVRNLQIHPLREHSRKPDGIRDDIVSLVGDLPRIELFARQSKPGWDSWGNQINEKMFDKET
jgi:N6-adenosine-specific RNA methylase IME4